MKYLIKNIIFFAFILTSFLCQSQTKFETGSWEQIKQKAITEDKLIFVDLYFTGCAPCAQMDEQVFPNKEVSAILNNEFVPFKSDIFKEEIGKRLSLKYAVGGFPTFLFLTAEGKVLDITSGYHEVDELIATLSSAKKNSDEKKYKKFSSSLSGDYPSFYVNAYMKGQRKVSFETLNTYLKSQKDLSAEIPFVIITGLRVGGIYGDFVLNNAKQLADSYSRMQVRNALITIIGRKAKVFGQVGDQTKFETILDLAKPVFTDKEWEKFNKIFQENFNKHNI